MTSRPSGLPRYEVSFFVKYANRPLDSQTEQLAYVVLYEWDPAQRVGYVYLPGPSDTNYRLNVRSIHREGRNGHWFRATRARQDAAAPLIRAPAR